jgi:hypothetical protein
MEFKSLNNKQQNFNRIFAQTSKFMEFNQTKTKFQQTKKNNKKRPTWMLDINSWNLPSSWNLPRFEISTKNEKYMEYNKKRKIHGIQQKTKEKQQKTTNPFRYLEIYIVNNLLQNEI